MMAPYATGAEMLDWANGIMSARAPDLKIGHDPAAPYINRWWIIPRNAGCNNYLHEILRSDDDRALHDHPWDNTTMIIAGRYIEHLPDGGAIMRETGWIGSRRATDAHRLEALAGERAITLFLTGPKLREWGFWCPQGWRHWMEFTAGENGERVGRGCAE